MSSLGEVLSWVPESIRHGSSSDVDWPISIKLADVPLFNGIHVVGPQLV